MKTIKKSNWAYRFIMFTFDETPTTTCGFYFDVLLVTLLSPVILYVHFLGKMLLEKTETKSSTKEISKGNWIPIMLFITGVAFALSYMAVDILFGYFYKDMTWKVEVSLAVAWMSLTPIIVNLGFKAYDKLKQYFCSPIKFID